MSHRVNYCNIFFILVKFESLFLKFFKHFFYFLSHKIKISSYLLVKSFFDLERIVFKMENLGLYQDIAKRTDGDIYVGVVGPVRTRKIYFYKEIYGLTCHSQHKQ